MTWIRFSYGDPLEWRRVLETTRHTVEFATSPALKQGGIHETQKPKYRGFDDYFFDNNHLNAGDEENTVRDPFS